MPFIRKISYAEAIREAFDQIMEKDDRVILFGLDVDDPKAIMGTTRGLVQKYGHSRVFGTPLSEDSMTGAAIGMALAGLRPIHNHIRCDFMMLAMNQIVNMAAKMRYMFGNQVNVPIVIRSTIGKSWGQGAQHSQSLYSMFAHVPGLQVVAPSTPYDAKGCMTAAVVEDNPIIYIDHRMLHFQISEVPEEFYTIETKKARITREGHDVTLVGISFMQVECLRAAMYLEQLGISAEVVDPVWLSPLDIDTIVKSVSKTRVLCVVDNDWIACSVGSEIVALVVERVDVKRIKRLGFAACPCPPSPTLEDEFYPNARKIASTVLDLLSAGFYSDRLSRLPEIKKNESVFKGPF